MGTPFRIFIFITYIHLSLSQVDRAKEIECGYEESANDYNTNMTTVPWAASVYYYKGNEKIEFAASIISPFLLITVANTFVRINSKNESVYEIYPIQNYTAVVQATNQTYKVYRIIPYKYFNMVPPSKSYLSKNDFALVHLADEIQFVQGLVAPICIPESNPGKKIHVTNQLGVSGWRFIDEPREVQKIHVLTESHCKGTWIKKLDINESTYEDRICAYKVKRKDEVDCLYNNNGVFMELGGKFYIAGFVNFCTAIIDSIYYVQLLHNAKIKWIQDSIRCGHGHFPCTNGTCKNLEELCDKHSDCVEDNLDEEPKYCRGSNFCPDNFFGCGIYGQCIEPQLVCDKNIDCENGEDEDCHVETPLDYSADESSSNLLDTNKPLMFTSIATILLLLMLLILFMHLIFKRLKNIKQVKEEGNHFKAIIEAEDSGPFKKEMSELDLEKTILGTGNFGKVRLGILKCDGTVGIKVAVKSLKVKCIHIKIDFEHELKYVMRIGKHENIANFMGYTRDNNLNLYLIYELCELGNLEDFLKLGSEKVQINKAGREKIEAYKNIQHNIRYTEKDMMRWCVEIAQGMAFLAKQKMVHRDLAARNILLNGRKIAKITDFGRSAYLYKKKYIKDSGEKNRAIPFRWMAVECIQEYVFTLESDVWSYGVTLWEIYTRGQVPYVDVKTLNPDFVQRLKNGLRPDMEMAKSAPPIMYL